MRSGTNVNQRGIARALSVSAPAVLKALPGLENKKLVIAVQDKDSKRWAIELNRDNISVVQLKRIDNLKQLYESGLVEYLYDKLPGTTIILFGSYSNGEDTVNSDIDLAVIGINHKTLDLEEYERILLREVVVNYYLSFSGMRKELLNNIMNGIVIKGGVEL